MEWFEYLGKLNLDNIYVKGWFSDNFIIKIRADKMWFRKKYKNAIAICGVKIVKTYGASLKHNIEGRWIKPFEFRNVDGEPLSGSETLFYKGRLIPLEIAREINKNKGYIRPFVTQPLHQDLTYFRAEYGG